LEDYKKGYIDGFTFSLIKNDIEGL